MSFIVYTLPRSRSTWLQLLFSYRENMVVGHDWAMACNFVDEFLTSWDRGLTGTIETGAVVAHKLVRAANPRLRTAVIFRAPEEVNASLWKFGISNPSEIEQRFSMMQEVAQMPGVFSCEWQELSNYETMRELWRHCLGTPFSPKLQERWVKMCDLNVQVDVPSIQEYLQHSRVKIQAMKEEVILRTAALKAEGGLSCQGLN